ncbi:MAG TPA: glycosyltransferase family 87 protein, partial [Candidatus Cybelea sp.]
LSGTRWVLAICAAVLAAISLLVLGLPANIEYFTSVLPAHALSELTRDTQYSFSAVLAALGVSPTGALRGGSLWYLAMVILGTLVAGRVARTTGNRAFLACIPPAFAVFGGTFIHVTQIAAAIPAAILLASYTGRAQRTAVVAALLLLAVPWGWVVSPVVLVAPFVPVAYLTWHYSAYNARTALICGIATIGIIGALMWLYTLHASHIGATLALPVLDPKLPESAWSAYSRHGSSGSVAAWVVRIPTWAALGILLAVCVRQARFVFRREQAAPIALALVCTILPLGAQFYGDRASGWLAIDFRAYYCAALAQREGQNPYFADSLHRCEASPAPPFYRAPARVTVPAPYPPYVLAALAPLTFLPFQTAVTLWVTLMIFAIGLAVYALAVTSGQGVGVALGALGLSAGLTSLSTGNMAPLGVAAIVVAAFCVQQTRWIWATIAIAVGMMEPQLALPAALACFVAYAPMRLPLTVAGCALALLSVAVAGPEQTVQYFTSIIPAHALAEVSRDNQYSLATIAAAAGVPDAAATFIGSLSYVVMTVLGILVGL